MKKVLFVCSANKDRSKTAEDHFSFQFPDMEFLSAGTNQKICEQEGTNPLSEDMLEWADMIFVMEEKHRQWIKLNMAKKYDHKIRVLSIEDRYKYNQRELVEKLEQKISPFFL